MARYWLNNRPALFPFLGLLGMLGTVAAAPAQPQKSLADYAQTALRDLTADVDVISKNNHELKKIGKGYVDGYSLSSQEFWWSVPDRVRFQGKKGLLTVRRITNGDRMLLEVPPLHRKVSDLSKKPGKGDSIADIGIITADWARDVGSRWLRSETRGGKTMQVFEYWERLDPRYKHTIVIDPQTKTMVERIDHHRNKKAVGFRKRFVYSAVINVNGINMPSRVELYNSENRLGAVMKYEKVRVNTNLSDNLFKI